MIVELLSKNVDNVDDVENVGRVDCRVYNFLSKN